MNPRNDLPTLIPSTAPASRHGARSRKNPGRLAPAVALSEAERANGHGEFAPEPDASQRLPVDSPERRRLPLLLRRAWYGLNQAFRHLTAQAGITPDQFTVLRTLREHEPLELTQSDLAEKMSSDPNTIASLLRRMEKQGLVERRKNAEDRRAHSLALQHAGLRRYNQVRRQAVALQMSILSALPESSRESFLAQLELLGNACRQAAEIGRVARVPLRPGRRNPRRGQRRKTPPPS
jgi:DNA-binding MarR family transcriptional regulator